MALASMYILVLTAGNLSAELRKVNGYLSAGSAAIVAAVMTNYASAQQFAFETSLRFTMLWLLLVVVLSGVSWFASVFVSARLAGLEAMASLPKYGVEWEDGEREGFPALGIRSMIPPMRPYGRRQMRKLQGDIDLAGIQSARWAAMQGLATLAQFLCIAIAAVVLFSGLRF